MINIDSWLKRRFRQIIWKTWKLPRTKRRNLIKLGISEGEAHKWANTRRGSWRSSKSATLHVAISNERLHKRGYRSLVSYYLYRHSDLVNRRDTRSVCPVV